MMLISALIASMLSFANTKKADFPKVPKLMADQMAVFIEDKYSVIQLKKHQEASFNSQCFKGKSLTCEAFTVYSQKTPMPSKALKHEAMNNPGARFCEGQGGTNLIAIDSKKKEYNVCRFKDGSMITSWDLYYKFNPQNVIK